MYLRLRQICLAAAELPSVADEFASVLGLQVCYRDPGVKRFGLENALFPIGDNFLEVVAPIEENTAVHRHLERHGGDCGYMVICQTDDQVHFRQRAAEAGVRTAFEYSTDELDYHCWQLHPKDMRAAFLEIDQQSNHRPDGLWHPAGPGDWKQYKSDGRVIAMTGVELQSHDPESLAARWDSVIGFGMQPEADQHRLALENADLRFVPEADGRGELLTAIDLQVTDPDAIVQAAGERGLPVDESSVTICGTRFNLVSDSR